MVWGHTFEGIFLGTLFYSLFKNSWVVDVSDNGSRNPRFGRQLHDWELEEVEVFFGRLYKYSISVGTEDIMVWLVRMNCSFSIKSFYFSLAIRRAETFPIGIIWNS